MMLEGAQCRIWCIVRSGKSEAGITNNKRLHSGYCIPLKLTRRAGSIMRPVCDSRASCCDTGSIMPPVSRCVLSVNQHFLRWLLGLILLTLNKKLSYRREATRRSMSLSTNATLVFDLSYIKSAVILSILLSFCMSDYRYLGDGDIDRREILHDGT